MSALSPSSVRRRLILWAPVALLLGYDFFLSSQSVLPAPPVRFPNVDKVVHAGYFFLMAAFADRALRVGHGWRRSRTALAVVAGFLAYGVLDELHQSFVPMRDSDAWDVVADVTGAALAAAFSEAVWRRFEK